MTSIRKAKKTKKKLLLNFAEAWAKQHRIAANVTMPLNMLTADPSKSDGKEYEWPLMVDNK